MHKMQFCTVVNISVTFEEKQQGRILDSLDLLSPKALLSRGRSLFEIVSVVTHVRSIN